MRPLLRIVHLMALGLWFGSVTFFSFFTALPIIQHLETEADRPDYWLHQADPKAGQRMAGDALEPVFARYFPFQVICGAAAILTLRAWHQASSKLSRVRLGLVTISFVLACMNAFWLAPRIHHLRNQRYVSDPQTANQAKEDFAAWHSYSLTADMVGLACVGAALALAARTPRQPSDANPPSNA